MRRIKRISSKISLVIMVCTTLSVAILAFMFMGQVCRMGLNDAEQRLSALALRYAAEFSGELDVIEEKTNTIVDFLENTIDHKKVLSDPDYLETYEPELAVFLEHFATKRTDSYSAYCYFNPQLSETPHDVYYVDGNGDKIPDRQEYIPFSYYDNTPTPSDDKYWWYGAVEKRDIIWTNPYEWDLKDNEKIKVVSCARPVYIDGELLAVVGTYYRFDAVNEAIKSIKPYGGGFAALFNENLDVVYHPSYKMGNRNTSDNLKTVEDGALSPNCDKILADNNGTISYKVDGQDKMLAYAKLSNGWIMTVNPETKDVYAALYEIMRQLIFAFGICLVLSALAAHLMGKTMVKPVLKVVEASKRIGAGDFDVVVKVPTNDEIHVLGDALNDMVGNIKRLNQELTQMAYYDPLTGLGNKNYFEKTAGELMAQNSQCYAYAILDINKFKLVNDIFGLEKGDLLLMHIAMVIRDAMEEGEICARFNADCFRMLMRCPDRKKLEQRLREISDKVLNYNFDANEGYKLSLGLGVYVGELDCPGIDLMGDRAKLALNNIKGTHVAALNFYNDGIRKKMLDELEIENTMDAALENGEFQLYLQPKYRPYDCTIQGAEALVRWVHPHKGIVPPDQFVPLFERNGFIANMDMYMLEQVCKLIKDWLDDGVPPIRISINQSRQYLSNPDYIPQLLGMLKRYEIPKSLVELEITETAFFENQEEMIRIVERLHDLGFVVSMDDFGSGYSSFNMLQDIPVDILKIDKNFFRDSVNSERGKKIVSNVISMSQELDMLVVAEGVETREQVEFLIKSGCDLIQGYYFDRPMPRNDLDEKIRNLAKQGN